MKILIWVLCYGVALGLVGIVFMAINSNPEEITDITIASWEDIEPYRLAFEKGYIELSFRRNKKIGDQLYIKDPESGTRYYVLIPNLCHTLITFFDNQDNQELKAIEHYSANLKTLKEAHKRWPDLAFDERLGTFQEMFSSLWMLYEYVKYRQEFLLAEKYKASKH